MSETIPQIEERILKFWKENKIFEKSIENRENSETWTFLDGPPFITGLPHYGSLLSSIPKDLYPRFWTMKGYKVRRVWGWDCHGLPIENKVENKLGIKTKKEIEEVHGVKKFIDECKLYVKESSEEWEWYIDRIARWVDFKNAYRTMDTNYMESVMWVFKTLFDKGLIYKGTSVLMYCPHCVTPISNFEVAMDADNYQEVSEKANTYKYKVNNSKFENTFFLAWSTTPWNKIATPALAVNPKITYVKVKQNNEFYILAKSTLQKLVGEYEIVEEIKGSDLVGLLFEPHFDYFKISKDKKAYVVIGADFVTADEGTGIVTIAAYGEEDLKAMKDNDIEIIMHVNEEGIIKPNVGEFSGLYYLDTNNLVNENLSKRGLMYREEEISHRVPTCWRCHTRLYYAPISAWFVKVSQIKDEMQKVNKKVNWFPKRVENQFSKSMESAPDWCISRNRYWGSPVPVWETEDGDVYVPGSISELEKLSGQKINDLHKPEIDEITFKHPVTGKIAKRVPEVLDSWIEAASASFGERHFPFDVSEDELKNFFPPDFIIEYVGQVRAWFYVLHVLGVALYGSQAFKNVIVTGNILGEDGRKMSKNYGNYPDPKKLIETYGGDALRLYLMGSPVMRAEDVAISADEYALQVRSFLFPLRNVFNFYQTYFENGNYKFDEKFKANHILDKWILSRLTSFRNEYTKTLEKYDTPKAVDLIKSFLVEDLSGWYIRRSRDRFDEAFNTLYFVLREYLKLIAPIVPFSAEDLYQKLTNEESVHLVDWPNDYNLFDQKLEDEMILAQKAVEMVHAIRKEEQIKVRQPLAKLIVKSPSEIRDEILDVVSEEVNVLEVVYEAFDNLSIDLDTKITDTLQKMGEARDIVRNIQVKRKEIGAKLSDKVEVYLPSWPMEYEDEIKEKVLATKIIQSSEFDVKVVS